MTESSGLDRQLHGVPVVVYYSGCSVQNQARMESWIQRTDMTQFLYTAGLGNSTTVDVVYRKR
jgi:hypothetical protein